MFRFIPMAIGATDGYAIKLYRAIRRLTMVTFLIELDLEISLSRIDYKIEAVQDCIEEYSEEFNRHQCSLKSLSPGNRKGLSNIHIISNYYRLEEKCKHWMMRSLGGCSAQLRRSSWQYNIPIKLKNN